MSSDRPDLGSIISNRQLELKTLMAPKYTWKCQLIEGTYWHLEEGKQPNAFHRFMQRICFGFKWSRIDD